MFLVYFFQMKLKTKMSILILYKLEKISFIRTIISVKMIILDAIVKDLVKTVRDINFHGFQY